MSDPPMEPPVDPRMDPLTEGNRLSLCSWLHAAGPSRRRAAWRTDIGLSGERRTRMRLSELYGPAVVDRVSMSPEDVRILEHHVGPEISEHDLSHLGAY
jgi:hypothetical protein